MFMKYSIVTRIYTEILINQAVDNFTSSRFRESRMEGGEAANMCEVLDRAEKRGELKGRLEGRLEKSKETAARLKARGFSNSDISDIVDIDIKTIDSWFPDDV
jgi:predicted transposase YdaD